MGPRILYSQKVSGVIQTCFFTFQCAFSLGVYLLEQHNNYVSRIEGEFDCLFPGSETVNFSISIYSPSATQTIFGHRYVKVRVGYVRSDPSTGLSVSGFNPRTFTCKSSI